ncbi:MAG: hypothetical protein J0M20_15725, partial [Burkholderiales bacterium]|nr:hypothetical protein [Burkholderiales bacterium]
ENNCAVLSIDGYPQDIFSTVMEMLKRNPELKVYAIHNADAKGHGLLINAARPHCLRFMPRLNSTAAEVDEGLALLDLALAAAARPSALH